MTFHRIELINESDDPAGWHTRVMLDGKPLYCREIHISADANGLTSATVTLDAICNVDVPADVIVTQEVLVSEVHRD